MVVRIERNFSLAGPCFLICCILASQLDANESDGSGCRPRSSRTEGEQRLSVAADDGQLPSQAAVRHWRTDDPLESSRPTAIVERNSNALAAEPANRVAAGSASNSENRDASASVDEITNRKSQPAIYDTYSDIFASQKNDSIIYSPAISGDRTPTSFTIIEESLIPTSEEIARCSSNFVAGSSLCNTTLHYPKLFVKNILKRRDSILHSFGNDVLSPRIKIPSCGIKFQVDQDFESLCASREFLYYPRMGKTASNEWKYIVQSDDNSQQYAQGVRVEVCAKENQKCDLVDNFPIGYDVQCVQKYTYRRLLAVSPNEKAATPDNFEFPSCCVCAYRSRGDGDLRSRTS